ncbi:hypothetical protein EON63_13255 [archaeon]|nr:MAG: hypothetical protein EON63_13255 [archaeon]
MLQALVLSGAEIPNLGNFTSSTFRIKVCHVEYIPYTIHHILYTIHHIPYTIHHTPYIIHHIPYTIHHIPYTIHHTPYTIQISVGINEISTKGVKVEGGVCRWSELVKSNKIMLPQDLSQIPDIFIYLG